MMIEGQNYGSYRHGLAGVNDYDWTSLPTISDADKQRVSDIVDGFKSKEDVQKWANENAGKADALFFAAVVGAADQKKLISLSQSLGVNDMLARSGISTTAVDAVTTLIAEADGYAAKLIAAGALTQADYDTQKATAKGAGWTPATAVAFRDAVKKALDDYNAKQGGAMGWLLPVGIAAVAFLALRK